MNIRVRLPPHNMEAEQALLGAMLVNNEAFYRVSDFLEPEHFFEPIHQRIFELCGDLIRAGGPATPVTLKTFLPGDLDVAGLTVNQYLARLAAEATTIINAEDYARTVYDLWVRRELIAIGEDMVNLAYDAPVDATPLSQIETMEQALYELAGTGKKHGTTLSQQQMAKSALEKAAHAYQNPGGLAGLSTGLVELDNQMGGLQARDYEAPVGALLSRLRRSRSRRPISSSLRADRAWAKRRSPPALPAMSHATRYRSYFSRWKCRANNSVCGCLPSKLACHRTKSFGVDSSRRTLIV
jgi:DnaB-like helicase N terminal domain